MKTLTDKILAVVKKAGVSGISPVEIAEKLKEDKRSIGYLTRNLAKIGKLKRLNEPSTRPQLFASIGKKQRMPPKADSITIITKAQPRNTTVKPERLKVEELLNSAMMPMTIITMVEKTELDKNVIRKIMWRLQQDGIAANVGDKKEALYKATAKIKASKKSEVAKTDGYVCNGTMPYAKFGDIPRMECAR